MSKGPLVSQPSSTPTRKVAQGTGYGALLGVVIAWLLGQFGVDMPPEVAAALGALLNGLVAYFVRERDVPEAIGT